MSDASTYRAGDPACLMLFLESPLETRDGVSIVSTAVVLNQGQYPAREQPAVSRDILACPAWGGRPVLLVG